MDWTSILDRERELLRRSTPLSIQHKNLMSYKVSGCYLVAFHVLQLLLNRFIQQKLCCISKSIMKRLQKLVKSNFPLFPYGHKKCMFVDALIGYIGSFHCFYLSVDQSLIFEDVYQYLLKMFFIIFALSSSPNHMPNHLQRSD